MLKWEKDLHAAFDKTATRQNVLTARKLIKGDVEPLDVSQSALNTYWAWSDSRSSHHYLLMTALNDLLGTCGVEHIGEVHTTNGPPVEYLNTGDSYAATLVYYRESGKFKVQDYATAVEWCEKHGHLAKEEY